MGITKKSQAIDRTPKIDRDIPEGYNRGALSLSPLSPPEAVLQLGKGQRILKNGTDRRARKL
jgi:hypothetical protein